MAWQTFFLWRSTIALLNWTLLRKDDRRVAGYIVIPRDTMMPQTSDLFSHLKIMICWTKSKILFGIFFTLHCHLKYALYKLICFPACTRISHPMFSQAHQSSYPLCLANIETPACRWKNSKFGLWWEGNDPPNNGDQIWTKLFAIWLRLVWAAIKACQLCNRSVFLVLNLLDINTQS